MMNNSNSNTEVFNNVDVLNDLVTGLNSFFNQLHLLVDDISEIVQSVLDVSIKETTDKDLYEWSDEVANGRGNDWGKAAEDMLDWREFLKELNLGEGINKDTESGDCFCECELDEYYSLCEDCQDEADDNELLHECVGCCQGDNVDDSDDDSDDGEWIEGYTAGYDDAKREFELEDPDCCDDEDFEIGYAEGFTEAKRIYDEIIAGNKSQFDPETESELKELIINFLFERFGSKDLND